MRKAYLGDGVYATYDETLGLILTTENGIVTTNRIVLEPAVYAAMTRYVEGLNTPVPAKETGDGGEA